VRFSSATTAVLTTFDAFSTTKCQRSSICVRGHLSITILRDEIPVGRMCSSEHSHISHTAE
jgi:hypothetical protein